MKMIRYSVMSLAGALAAVAANAGNDTVNVNVSATVVATCRLAKVADVAFSTTIDPTATATLLAEGQVTLTCNKGAAPQLTIGDGLNFATVRNMKAATSTDLIAYSLKQPTGATLATCPAAGAGTDWIGSTALSATALFASSGGANTLKICGQLTTPQLGASSGAYTDTVIVTATF
jgi:spore coat protein U-like protein